MRFVALERLINLKDGYRRRFKIDNLDVVLLQEDGQVHIVAGLCPHQAQSLETAPVEEGLLYCPRHQYAFSLRTGRQVNGLCGDLKIFSPVYEGTQVGLTLAE